MSTMNSRYTLSRPNPIMIPVTLDAERGNASKNASNLSLRNTYTTHKTPITPGTTTFRISVQEFRDKINEKSKDKLKLKQAQTDNYYNTTNASLPLHHYQSTNCTNTDTDINIQISDSESESEFVIFNKEYSQYTPTPKFPDIRAFCNTDDNSDITDAVYSGEETPPRLSPLQCTLNELFQETSDKVNVLLQQRESKQKHIIQQLMDENMRLKAENKALNDEVNDLKQSTRNNKRKKYHKSWNHHMHDHSVSVHVPRHIAVNTIVNDDDTHDLYMDEHNMQDSVSAAAPSQHQMKCSFSALPNVSPAVVHDISEKTQISITSINHRKTTKPRHKHKRKHKSAKIRHHVIHNLNIIPKEETVHESKNKKQSQFTNVTSWKTKMNLQNDERCAHSRTPTPTLCSKYVFKGNGIRNLPTPSRSRICAGFTKRKTSHHQ